MFSRTLTIGSLLCCAAFGASAEQAGFDPLALDHFIGANIAIETAENSGRLADVLPGVSLLVAGKGVELDAEGFLLGPDGNRVVPHVKVELRAAAFR